MVPEVRVLCVFVERVAGLPMLERADERSCADGCMCVSSRISVGIHAAESSAFTMNPLLMFRSLTCFSLLELILLQQELYLKSDGCILDAVREG